MASDTVVYQLTQVYQNVSQAAVDCLCIVRGPGSAELYFGPTAQPAASKVGTELNASNREGAAFGSISTDDAVWARTQAPHPVELHVTQKAT